METLPTDQPTVWQVASYYQLLLQTVIGVKRDEFQQTEQLAIMKLIALLLQRGGIVEWKLEDLEAEIGISRAALNGTLRKLKANPEHSFAAFLRVDRGENAHSPYRISLLDWSIDTEDHQVNEGSLTGGPIANQWLWMKIPVSLVDILPQIFDRLRSKIIWETHKRIDGVTISIVAKRPLAVDGNMKDDKPLVVTTPQGSAEIIIPEH